MSDSIRAALKEIIDQNALMASRIEQLAKLHHATSSTNISLTDLALDMRQLVVLALRALTPAALEVYPSKFDGEVWRDANGDPIMVAGSPLPVAHDLVEAKSA